MSTRKFKEAKPVSPVAQDSSFDRETSTFQGLTSSHFRAEPGLRLPRRTQHAPRPQGSTVAHDSILSLLREYDPARPGPPSCRPCIAHAPLKKPVHNPPEPEQELPVNNAYCAVVTPYRGFLRDYVLGPQCRKLKSTSLAPSPSNFPWTPATLSGRPSVRASHHASEPSQANIAASFPPNRPSIPSHLTRARPLVAPS
ncbi:hypothetical protein CFIO01_09929 [Colletotrichum fioriniae PJ7]|uniref:Uncharacterized protein n=1 Tax=Colletotrichum fioriniae PJ7 TaxID=1445577 RepID=A0A010R0R6_9PEZI|nr:hypothetical protein CFIO01_09929 [Colletotrichum fioriniae PJ7]